MVQTSGLADRKGTMEFQEYMSNLEIELEGSSQTTMLIIMATMCMSGCWDIFIDAAQWQAAATTWNVVKLIQPELVMMSDRRRISLIWEVRT